MKGVRNKKLKINFSIFIPDSLFLIPNSKVMLCVSCYVLCVNVFSFLLLVFTFIVLCVPRYELRDFLAFLDTF